VWQAQLDVFLIFTRTIAGKRGGVAGYLSGDDFASRLERALQRSERAKLIEARAEPTD
jgi:hypothetical protein